MKKVMFAAALAAIVCGCVSEELTWGGLKAVRNPDGTVLVDPASGKPYYEKDQNHLDRFSHLNDIELKELHVKADGDAYEAHLGSLGSFTGSNTVNVINASLSGTTKLVAECGALYAKIAGGATADVTASVVSKMISYFKSSGGDAEKATAAIDKTTNAILISDGSTCIECTEDGVCKECQVTAQ